MKIKLIIPIVIIIFLTSCTQVIVTEADEIRMNKWSASLQNGSEVSLCFEDETAEFRVKSNDKGAQTKLKGLFSIDDKNIMIYNQSERESYFFAYKINNNKLTLRYGDGKITLTREN